MAHWGSPLTEPFLFDRQAVLLGLEHLDAALQDRGLPRQELIVVGGSYLALTDLREATRDVDTITQLADEVRVAVRDVARDLGYPDDWLNDHAVMFRPQGLTRSDCTVEFDGERLLVLVPVADWIFVMKLYAGRAIDRPDLIRIWSATSFETPAQAVARFWEAYPQAPEDEYLTAYVEEIERLASDSP